MGERTSVVNISGDHEETVVQLSRHLGTNRIRRQVFDAIYGRGTKPKSKKQIMDAANIRAKGTNAQQVQNALDHLCKHHLIVRLDNSGIATDGSRYVYQKDPTVRANREKIVRLADNKKAAEKVPTKRKPSIDVKSNGVKLRNLPRVPQKKQKRLTVLYLVASPNGADPLRVDLEVRKVQEAIRGSPFRDRIKIEYRPAADINSLIDGLNDHRPQVIHFSGHGNEVGILTDSAATKMPSGKFLSFDLLAKALEATDSPPEVVVLNSCKSSAARRAVLPAVKVVVSMQNSVTDIAASAFSVRFYAGLASGQSMKAAFSQGKVAVESVSLKESDTPELLHEASVNPSKIVLT